MQNQTPAADSDSFEISVVDQFPDGAFAEDPTSEKTFGLMPR